MKKFLLVWACLIGTVQLLAQIPFKSELLTFEGQVMVESSKTGKLFPLKKSTLFFLNKDSIIYEIKTDPRGKFKAVIDTTFQLPMQDFRMEVLYRGARLEVSETYRGLGKVVVIPTFSQPTQK